ncbi:MAG: molybdopterin biosynthesis protein [Anaerolineales bacterium]|nr:molybdopterin biosynthesis protein [Anaerolineales bacterium]
MSIYLHDIPLSTAQNHLRTSLEEAGLWRVLGSETIPLDENALGRVLSEPIWASISSPHYHASAMDGFAVIAENTSGAGPSTPLTFPIEAESAHYVDTGDPLPEWANAVIPIENVESLDQDNNITPNIQRPASIRIRAAVSPWSHIRPLGEDIVATQLVLPSGHTLRPVDLGAIAASGHQSIQVARKPKVAILPTGTELVPIGSKLKSGDILEYNSLVLAAQIKTMGGDPTRYPITKDDFDVICKNVADAAQDHDLILLNAGSSAGMEDFSAKVVETLGQLLVHGVAVRPGHPVILGIIDQHGKKVPIVGVPGYPVSAALTNDIFVEPLMAKWLGRRPLELPTEEAKLTRKITSPAGDDDFVRVAAGMVGGNLLAAPLSRGAGVITSLVQADGLVLLPSGVQGMEAGGKVQVRLYRTKSELERTIFCIGSHDLILDLMAQFLTEADRRLISANAGSQGGLISVKRGEAHMAGTHLLDPETGEYNLSYIRRFIPDVPVKLVTLAGREQGLVVRRGNPKSVHDLKDLTRPDVQFINRQRGSGTRVLLDYHLNQLNLSADQIHGYSQEEYTHLGVAAAVASGRATCGLVIAAAAQALDLDFIPLFQERYDLVFPQEYANSQLLTPLFDLLAAPRFRAAISKLAGYDTTQTGNVVLND